MLQRVQALALTALFLAAVGCDDAASPEGDPGPLPVGWYEISFTPTRDECGRGAQVRQFRLLDDGWVSVGCSRVGSFDGRLWTWTSNYPAGQVSPGCFSRATLLETIDFSDPDALVGEQVLTFELSGSCEPSTCTTVSTIVGRHCEEPCPGPCP
ncbi:MAG: hypothetical protein AAF533_12865 [Acidobacteriota bacterium]